MFQVGDRVVAVCDHPSLNNEIMVGSTGVVCDVDPYSPSIGVCWDVDVNGHDCNSNCEYSHGWYVRNNEISLDFPDCGPFVCADEQDLDELLT